MAAVPTGLVMVDGDLPALLACAAASRADRLVSPGGDRRGSSAWTPPGLDTPREVAAQRQAEFFGLAMIGPEHRQPEPARDAAWTESLMLLEASRAAAESGLHAVVWPIHAGPELDLDQAARAVDRALLVSRLASLDAEARGIAPIEVHAPYADFTSEQVAELALDMDLPVSLCWWWDDPGDDARRARQSWLETLESVGWRGAAPEVTTVTRQPAREER